MISSLRLASLTMLSVLGTYATESLATVASASGTVAELRLNGSTLPVENAIFITGVTTLAACPTSTTDAGVTLVLLRFKGDAQGRSQQNAALSSQYLGKTVTVSADDTVMSPSGYCYLRSIHTTP